ncbi:MAG: rhodanese-like domain-containing protein [Colwellia sp.]
MRHLYKIIIFSFYLNVFYSGFSLAEEPQSLATPQITQTEFVALQSSQSDFLLLDVRSAEEFSAGHIKNAKNIPHSDINNHLTSLLAFKDKKVIVYCRSGRRAGLVEKELVEKGFSNVLHLQGDMNGWQESNLPTVSQKE